MKVSDHTKVLSTFLDHHGDNEFTLAFFREVALHHPSVFNKVCDKLTVGTLAPFKCVWKEKVIAFIRSNQKVEAIKYLRDYSRDFPATFGAVVFGSDGKPLGLGLKEAKDIVESLNNPQSLGLSEKEYMMKTCPHCHTRYNPDDAAGHMCQEMMNRDLENDA